MAINKKMNRVLVDCELTKSDALYIYIIIYIFRVFYPFVSAEQQPITTWNAVRHWEIFLQVTGPFFQQHLG